MEAGRVAWTCLVLLFAALAVSAVAVMVRENTGGAEGAEPAGSTVVMANIAFAPTSLEVSRGTEVTFDNRDVAPHTVTADNRSLDSGLVNPGKAFRLVVNEPLTYHCELHPSMKAEVLLTG